MKKDLEYYYDAQFKRLLVQFLAIFTSIKVTSGKTNELDNRFIDVMVKSGSSSRVVAAIKADNTQNKVIRLPMIAGHVQAIELAPDLRKGTLTERSTSYMPSGGTFPDDIRSVQQVMPVPYWMFFDLNIFSSSQEQHWEIMEQILMIFDPTLSIQTSDDPFDWTRMKEIELTGISGDDNIPGVDRKIIQTTLNFKAPIYISAPAQILNNYIAEIRLRVGAVTNLDPIAGISELDQQGVEYDTIAKLSNLDLQIS